MYQNQRRSATEAKPFLNIRDTCNVTGLSQRFLRNGCRSGKIPCVMSGNTYMINIPLLLEQLNEASKQGGTFVL